MRTISKKTKYGLSALLRLARQYESGPVLIATIAEEEGIPIKFLEGILLQLRNRGILESKIGRRGGYRLSRPPSQITIGSVVRCLEGPLAPLPCASETAFRPCAECKDVERCGTRIIMRRVRDATAQILDGTSLEDVLRQVDELGKKDARDALMYYI